jgi:eukaryotic-like serine/threonine-protein kinase
MASVWVAEDTSRGRNVAVKVLDPELAFRADVVERFMMEAQAIARIRSPYVPEIYGHGSLLDGSPFIAMELLDGVDLGAYLRVHRRLSARVTARVISQVASALSEAHRLGIVHRDVKPENIFVTGDGDEIVSKLFDFGIAKIPSGDPAEGLTQMGTLMGTPSYMSAEQLLSAKDVDQHADLWSLAVVAYVALTGKLPFEGETFPAVCLAIHEGVFELPSSLNSVIPREIDAWMLKALNPNPRNRFRTATALADALMAVACERKASEARAGAPLAERAMWPSLAGLARTRRSQPEQRRPSLAALALCAGSIAYLGTSPVPASVSDRLAATWSAAAGLATASEAALASASTELMRRATASMTLSPPPTDIGPSALPSADAVSGGNASYAGEFATTGLSVDCRGERFKAIPSNEGDTSDGGPPAKLSSF